MLWDCCENVPISQASLEQAWVTMVGLISASTHHSASVSWLLRFGSLSWEKSDHFLGGYGTQWWHVRCYDAMRECEVTDLIPLTNLHQAWVAMNGLPSTSYQHSSSVWRVGSSYLVRAEMLGCSFNGVLAHSDGWTELLYCDSDASLFPSLQQTLGKSS